jgi:hypothetical protein
MEIFKLGEDGQKIVDDFTSKFDGKPVSYSQIDILDNQMNAEIDRIKSDLLSQGIDFPTLHLLISKLRNMATASVTQLHYQFNKN